MNRQSSRNAAPVSFLKGFAGVYGRLDPSRPGMSADRIDFHGIRSYSTTNHLLHLIGTSTPSVPIAWPWPAEQVAVKGRPFWMTDDQTARKDDPGRLDDLLSQLDGKFSICIASADGLCLATDLIGAGSVYYAPRGQRVFYATHLGFLLCLLDETPAFNLLGAVSLLISRAQIERETQFRNIFRLGAGERLNASRSGDDLALSTGRYANVAEVLSRDTDGMPTGPNAFGELLRASLVREQYPAGTALMLSGGRDSKAIALAKPDRDSIAVTYGTSDSRDLRHARLLAAGLGIEHRQVPYDKWTWGSFAKQIVGLHAGATGLQIGHNVVGFAWARQFFSLAISGFLGGAVTGGHVGTVEAVPEQRRISMLCSTLNAQDIDFRGTFPNEVKDLIETVRVQHAALSGLSPVQSLMILDWTIRQASRISLVFDLSEWYCDVSYPFYYRPLLRFMFNRPFSDLRNRSFYDAWLASAAARSGLQGLPRRQKMDDVLAITQSLARKRRLPNRLFSWAEVTDRSRAWLEQTLAEGSGPLRDLSKRSYEATLRDRGNHPHTFLLSIPLMLATERDWQAGALMRP